MSDVESSSPVSTASESSDDEYIKRFKEQKKLKGYIYEFENIPKHSDYNGKAYLMPSPSLRSKDWCQKINLLPNTNKPASLSAELIHGESNKNIIMVKNLFTKDDCDAISYVCDQYKMQKVQYASTRNNKRLVIFDKNFSEHVWETIKPLLVQLFDENMFQLTPLGFNVLHGVWEFAGVNEAIRFNSYESKFNEKFDVHRDAQFCPSGDTRSLLSVVIYLNDDFTGGETKFYIPKQQDISTKGMSLKDEISLHRGICEGYQQIVVKPECGSAVIFNQSILHESAALKDSSKRILKTDIMVSRKKKFGFQVSNEEEEDFLKCLNFFRDAQQNELNENNNVANELYEQCLSIRYSYPTKSMLANKVNIVEENCLETKFSLGCSDSGRNLFNDLVKEEIKSTDCNPFLYFPIEVWCNLFSYLKEEKDVVNIVSVFPQLKSFKRPFDKEKIIPRPFRSGVFSSFDFKHSQFIKENVEAICRVLAGYSIFLLGHKKFDNSYCVNYLPDEDKVVTIEKEDFFENLFYNEASYGSVYSINPSKVHAQNPEEDFSQSVDRNYMLFKHNKEFVGIDFECEFGFSGVFNDNEESEIENTNNMFSSDSDDAELNENHKLNNIREPEDTDNKTKKDSDQHIENCNDQDKQQVVDFEQLPFNDSSLSANYINSYIRLYENIIDNRIDKSDGDSDDYCDPSNFYDLNYEREAKAHICLPRKHYAQALHDSLKVDNAASAAVIRRLSFGRLVSLMKSDEHCECFGQDHFVTGPLLYRCESLSCNHLIADFSKETFTVTKNFSHDDKMFKHLKDRVLASTDYEIKAESLINCFRVDITPLADSGLSFNHASCQCIFPSVHLQQYSNLQSYPYLKHVYVIFKEIENVVHAWTCYGGIVAL